MVTGVLPLEHEEVRLLVSSRHLRLASEYFLKLLAGSWKETSLPNALPIIEAQDWDVDAFLILMKVIHGRLDDVPTVISLEMVAQVAVLVDYYQCHETMKFASKLWLERLSKQVLNACSRRLVLKIFVAWVFDHQRLFAKATKMAILTCQGVLPTLGLPIPDAIISKFFQNAHLLLAQGSQATEEIERQRQKSLREIADTLHSLHAYLKGRAGCSEACSYILCGALADAMYTSGFLALESTDFPGQSVVSLSKVSREIETPQWHLSNTSDKKACALSTFLRPCMDRIEYDQVGLELQQFKR
ncbi:hypothetical protein CGCA056_v006886 [Colletotrichum aenigma]|uniref:uncharacterized protein n=1 Tax=Colletotrichum aenigma TaxID=1215731 RepID=UPI0018726111|nr:uncharacterized protein CGCA056_v006886 [Colletotrichum aenigma]KAF5522349.1 hypothetical protein CGCA056_v006886 [Colletotrichum aenigma]